jgi:hypothetical protein
LNNRFFPHRGGAGQPPGAARRHIGTKRFSTAAVGQVAAGPDRLLPGHRFAQPSNAGHACAAAEVLFCFHYYREREMLNVVMPSAARNLLANAARCFASPSMTFNHFRSH